jgi:arylsulfatase A-like enzyme
MSNRTQTRRDFLKTVGACTTTCLLTSPVPVAQAASDEAKPNIIWVNCEDINPALGCYGDPIATTPNLDRLASEGILYRNAFATAPICAPSRSCLITGLYATSLGTQHLRSVVNIPDTVKTLPHYLRERDYFCTNTGKTDYNFDAEGVWDFWSSKPAPWRQRRAGQPFFTMITIGGTHEGPVNSLQRYQQAVADLPQDEFHDPDKVKVPPYYPDTPEVREIWAHCHDLITVMDGKVGDIIQQLKDDGLYEETIVFFFSDHGFGLPRHKRWLNDSGLHVPLIIHVPARYQHLATSKAGTETDRLVSFVDFAPTVLNLAGARIPLHMQGAAFLGAQTPPARKYVFGARSRADDMFEVSRAIRDDRYIYIRHYMPHLPYIQPGQIFSDVKWSFKVLRKLHREGKLNPEAEFLWRPTKPIEELYDLQTDPYEIDNLAQSPRHRAIRLRLAARLRQWALETRDAGFLQEAEMHRRGAESTIYEMAQDPIQYDLARVHAAAELVGNERAPVSELTGKLKDQDSGVRYWAATALLARGADAEPAADALAEALADESPSVQVAAAEALCALDRSQPALPVLAKCVDDARVTVALHAARTIQMIGSDAKPLVPVMRRVIKKYAAPPGSPRPWKDFNYAAFITWALEVALQNCAQAG